MRAHGFSVVSALIFLGLFCAPAGAVNSVTWFRSGCLLTPGLSPPQEAIDACLAECNSTNESACSGGLCVGTTTCHIDSGTYVYGTWPAITVTWNFHSTPSGVPHTSTDSGFGTLSSANNAICPSSGSKVDIFTPGPSATGTLCGSDGCLYMAGAPTFIVNSPPGNHYLQSATSVGQQCSSSLAMTPTSSVTPTGQGPAPNCQVGAGGVLACDPGNGTGCGQFNGDEVCVPALPPNSCVSFASGGVACTSSAGAQPGGPAPNNGTPGAAAAPDGNVTYNTNTVNYYNSTTVAGSSVPATTGAPSPTNSQPVGTIALGGATVSTSGTGGGGGTGGTVTNGNAAANGDCDVTAGRNCTSSGDALVPSLTRADSVESLGNAFLAGIEASPIYTAVGSISTAFPTGGACPDATFTVFDHEYNFMTSGCALWTDNVEAPLELVMAGLWAFLGVLVVLRA
jgi:hypothetical protein